MASFIPENFRIDSAESVVSLFNQLIERPINSVTELEHWLKDASELESHISEDMAWRYIRMTCDTKNKDHESKYLQFVQEIQPQLAPLEDQLNRKIADCIRVSRVPYFRVFAQSPNKLAAVKISCQFGSPSLL